MRVEDFFSRPFISLADQMVRAMIESDAGIKAAVVATTDGFLVVSALKDGSDGTRIAALASSISTIGSIATQEAGLGRCSSVTLKTDNGFAVVQQFTCQKKDLVLIAVAGGQAMLAQVMYQANRFAIDLAAA